MKENFINICALLVIIVIFIAVAFGFDLLSKKICELRGGKYISGSQNSMCRFD